MLVVDDASLEMQTTIKVSSTLSLFFPAVLAVFGGGWGVSGGGKRGRERPRAEA